MDFLSMSHFYYLWLVEFLPCFFCPNEPDLRDDKQFFIDHPGAVPISTAQVLSDFLFTYSKELLNSNLSLFLVLIFLHFFKGEELRKLIGSPAYIECSSKTQQVYTIQVVAEQSCKFLEIFFQLYLFVVQNVKAVFDAAIRVVLQPPKQKKKKSKAQKACSILWFGNRCKVTRAPLSQFIGIVVIPYCCMVADPFLNSRFCFVIFIFSIFFLHIFMYFNRLEYPRLGKQPCLFYGHKFYIYYFCIVAFGNVLWFSLIIIHFPFDFAL